MGPSPPEPDRQRTIFALLLGDASTGQIDHYQRLQAASAEAEARRAGIALDISFAPGFDQLRTLRRRLAETKAPVDAVITEPASLPTLDLILRDLKGKVGLILLNIASPSIAEHAQAWPREQPFGSISTDHLRIGEIQGRQVNERAPQGATVLCVSGPSRASAARERHEGLASTVRRDLHVLTTEAGDWNENDGALAFNSWYGVFKARRETVAVVAAQSDELAAGALSAARALANPAHREMFSNAKFLGVDACPGFGKELVESGTLSGSVTTPANADIAVRYLVRFWHEGVPVPLKSFTKPTPFP